MAMLAYALSFALTAASRGATIPGYVCAYWTLLSPLTMDTQLIEKGIAEYIAILVSGWINIVFLAAVAMRWRSGTGRAFRILRTTTLVMIPFSWIVYYCERAYPREGHVLWVVGMVVALFSARSSSNH
jgi:hypothetical protein